jgi:hypothetical protein
MPSKNYEIIWRAMHDRKQISCTFKGRYREVCPIVLGYSATGRERVLVYQVGGETSSGSVLPGWRSFYLDEVHDPALRRGRWREGNSHQRPQSHIHFVDADVNIPETLTREKPLPVGSPLLRPPRDEAQRATGGNQSRRLPLELAKREVKRDGRYIQAAKGPAGRVARGHRA